MNTAALFLMHPTSKNWQIASNFLGLAVLICLNGVYDTVNPSLGSDTSRYRDCFAPRCQHSIWESVFKRISRNNVVYFASSFIPKTDVAIWQVNEIVTSVIVSLLKLNINLFAANFVVIATTKYMYVCILSESYHIPVLSITARNGKAENSLKVFEWQSKLKCRLTT